MNLAFDDFTDQFCLDIARLVPEFPTQMGLFQVGDEPVPQHYFSRIDAESVKQRQQLLQSGADELQQFSLSELDDTERVTAGFLAFFTQYIHERGLIGLAGSEFDRHENLLRPAVGLQCELPLFLTDLHPMRHAQDAEDYISRLRSIPALLRQAGDQCINNMQQGFCPPVYLQDATIKELDGFTAQSITENVVYTTFCQKTLAMAELKVATREQMCQEVASLLQAETGPAYQDLSALLVGHRDESVTEPGAWRLPDGEAWYEFLLRCATTTSLGAAEIHDLGLVETERLEGRIIDASRELRYTVNSIADCHQLLDADLGGSLEDTEENRQAILTRARELVDEMRIECGQLFHQLPQGPLDIKAMPRFAESNRNQSYQPPSLDGSRPGFMELSLGQILAEPGFELPILVYHEIYPGHHLQIATAGELAHLPDLRKITTFDAYIEGWAKYAETIPHQHGINSDPRLNLSRMRRELISTANLAMDTGIHHKRWTLEQAMNFFMAHTGVSENFARFLAHRSASVPAQMCAYKIGMMKMLALKERWFDRHGTGADIRDFHGRVLGSGALPLDLLEQVVNGGAEGGSTTAGMQEVEQRREQLPREARLHNAGQACSKR